MASATSAYSSIASFLSTTTTVPPSPPVRASSSFSSSLSKLVKSSSFLSSSSFSKTKSRRNLISTPPSLLHRPRRLFTGQPRAAGAASSPSGTQKQEEDIKEKEKEKDRIRQVHSLEEFDAALRSAGKKLVVVEYATSKSEHHKDKIYPFMVQLSRTCGDVEFLLVLGDESEGTRELCRREKIEKVPHFSFYKDMERVHDEAGSVVGPDELMGDVLYYGNSHSEVVQLHSREDADSLMAAQHHKLIVLDVGLKHCGPCVKVYPTVIKLSRSMADTVVFARMNGDENDSCMQFLKDMEVIQVPTFLFIRDGQIRGRYVGSGKGELIGEILRYQGVRVTY